MATSNKYKPWTKEWIIADKTAVEAGYVDNKDDRGGETNCGITKTVALQYKTQLVTMFKWDGTMRNLTVPMAFYIYDVAYWKVLRLDEVFLRSPAIADKLFDIGINAGTGVAGKWLQTILSALNLKQKFYPDLVVDGNLGPKTIQALDACLKARGSKKAQWTILKALLCKQGAHYIDISIGREDNETFTFGWLGRLDHNLVDYYRQLGGD